MCVYEAGLCCVEVLNRGGTQVYKVAGRREEEGGGGGVRDTSHVTTWGLDLGVDDARRELLLALVRRCCLSRLVEGESAARWRGPERERARARERSFWVTMSAVRTGA